MVAVPRTGPRATPVESALRPCRDIAERPMAFLFTDLRHSTALYERMGDVAAYEIVRCHFAFLAGIVLGHDGLVVKTIGDAVMAAFGNPADAVKAALDVQARIIDFNRTHAEGDDGHLAIRVGVHSGDSIRVEFAGGLDYFWSAVNLTARLRSRSRDGDVVLSQVVAEHPVVRLLLATMPTRRESLPFKGFDGLVRFVRVMPAIKRSTGDDVPLAMTVRHSARTPRACLALGGR